MGKNTPERKDYIMENLVVPVEECQPNAKKNPGSRELPMSETRDQPELPIEGAATPGEEKAREEIRRANGNGASTCLAEDVPAPSSHIPLIPKRSSWPASPRGPRLSRLRQLRHPRPRHSESRDGLKPVQRRILWALHEKDDGRFIKVANVVGHTMQYHPHGDASIGDALVVLANKRYLIEGQGNFGNIFTGDPAAAPRYIECRLTELARTELFNDEITDFIPSYDGRNKEPVTLPCKLPLTLMLGTEGIAVGLARAFCRTISPNCSKRRSPFSRKQPFKCLPDFATGGLMDARDYQDGKGSVKVRAKHQGQGRIHRRHQGNSADDHDGFAHRVHRGRRAKGQAQGQIHQRFHVRERRDRNQMPGGVDAEKLVDALYAFTDCESPSPAASSSSRTTARWS
jgi:hypothetical protein